MGVLDRLKHAWNSFIGDDQRIPLSDRDFGYSTNYRPDRVRLSNGNERSIVTSIYNRIAIDVASVPIVHSRLDSNGRFLNTMNSGLHDCLTVEANKDQHARAFIQDIVMSMFDEGCVAVVPVDTTNDIINNSFDILSLRTGKIKQWYPEHVQVELYNDRKGIRETLIVPKKSVAIIENPYYAVMNDRNSISQRLIRKLNILDAIDEQSGSGKLDLIIQLPYVIKSEARKKQADKRKENLEQQLADSKYGIAYTDGSEKITQLNRSVENNLLKQIEYLTSMLNGQLGINSAILDGTAGEVVMLNYRNRTVEPVLSALTLEFNRKFLTKTARTQMQSIKYFDNPFKLVTITNLAEVADKFTRNEILTSNEVRQAIGFKPIDDPRADELRNKNLNDGEEEVVVKKEVENEDSTKSNTKDGENQNG